METKIVKLSFLGPVHFGKGRLTDSGISCDAATFFSALYIEALHEGLHEGLIEAVRSDGLSLSDAFPYVGDTKYLPKPMVAPEVFDERNRAREARGDKPDSRERKANKKLAYVSVARYADYLAGNFDSIAELDQFRLGASSLQSKVNLTRAESDDSEPYFVGSYRFNPGAGLYFIVRGGYDLTPLLEQLSYAGLGGKRTSGYGRFVFSVENGDKLLKAACPQSAAGTGAAVLLASAAPREAELDDALLEGARYRLVRKGGFVQSVSHSDSPQKKRDMYLFAAGSTFVHKFEGDVFDVNATPGSHPVYRYAKAMWMEV